MLRRRHIGVGQLDAAMLWIEENQLSRRNLKPDQLAVIAFSVQTRRSEIAKRQRAISGGLTGGVGRPKNSLEDNVTSKLSEPKDRTRAAVAKEIRSKIAMRQRAVKAINTRWGSDEYLSDNVTDKYSTKSDTRAAVAMKQRFVWDAPHR